VIRFWLPTTLLAAEVMALLKKVQGNSPANTNRDTARRRGHFDHQAEKVLKDHHLRERLQDGPTPRPARSACNGP